jgi:hypothetical protein
VRDLAKDGVSYFQLDSLLYVRPLPAKELKASIESDNIVLDAAREAGLTVGLHMCRGNNRSRLPGSQRWRSVLARCDRGRQSARTALPALPCLGSRGPEMSPDGTHRP